MNFRAMGSAPSCERMRCDSCDFLLDCAYVECSSCHSCFRFVVVYVSWRSVRCVTKCPTRIDSSYRRRHRSIEAWRFAFVYDFYEPGRFFVDSTPAGRQWR
jgi:hypothetical protein